MYRADAAFVHHGRCTGTPTWQFFRQSRRRLALSQPGLLRTLRKIPLLLSRRKPIVLPLVHRSLPTAVRHAPLSLALAVHFNAQAVAAQGAPEALTAAYNQAIQAHDWTGAAADTQTSVHLSATAQNLRLLANAQLNSGTNEESLASYLRAIAAAQLEKPARGQPEADWKDNLAKTYIGEGNALLKLHRTAIAVRQLL